MKLIREEWEEVEILTENTNGEKQLFIEGIFLQANQQNRNGRLYPIDIMRNEVSRYMREFVTKNRALGELGHPEGPQINLDRVSHMIVDLKEDGNNNFVGKAKILSGTPNGEIVKGLLSNGVRLGVSSRGMGSLKSNSRGIQEVQNDFRLATAADIVADPSAPQAFVNGIMEGVEWFMKEDGDWESKVNEKVRTALEESALIRLNDFINSLKVK